MSILIGSFSLALLAPEMQGQLTASSMWPLNTNPFFSQPLPTVVEPQLSFTLQLIAYPISTPPILVASNPTKFTEKSRLKMSNSHIPPVQMFLSLKALASPLKPGELQHLSAPRALANPLSSLLWNASMILHLVLSS